MENEENLSAAPPDQGKENPSALSSEIERLTHSLVEAEAMLSLMTSGQMDAVIDPVQGNVLLLYQAQQSLQHSEQQFRSVFEGVLDALLILNDQGQFVDANPSACTLFGLAHEELLQKQIGDFTIRGFDWVSAWRPFLERGGVQRGVMYIVLGQRRVRHIEYAITANILPGRHLTVLSDITERRQAERLLEKATQLQQDILNALPVNMALLDHRGRIVAVNAAWKEFAADNGYRGTNFGLGTNYLDICAEAHRAGAIEAESVLSGLRQVLGGKVSSFTLEYPCHAPTVQRWFRLLAAPVNDRGRRKVVVMHIDITQLKLMELQQIQTQKLQAVGALAAGIAHEINTPIQFISDNVHFLSDAFGSLQEMWHLCTQLKQILQGESTAQVWLEQVSSAEAKGDWAYLVSEVPLAIAQTIEGLERVSHIVQAMRTFAHPPGGEMALVDLNEALQTSLVVARNEYKYVADIVTEFDPHLPQVQCDLGDINQVFLNLIVNAAHAIAAKCDETFTRGVITIHTYHSKDEVMVRVSDNGTGIPDEIRSRLFEPFFTTKPIGQGTGQGLAIAHAIITKKHKGRLTFDSELGRGSVFTLYLPIPLPEADSMPL